MQVIAIDWSGRERGEGEHLWAAIVRDGRLDDLWNGRTREQVIAWLCALAGEGPLVAGLDFAFSFPRWWCERQGWTTAQQVWRAAAAHGADDPRTHSTRRSRRWP
jgi:hypothetical protein